MQCRDNTTTDNKELEIYRDIYEIIYHCPYPEYNNVLLWILFKVYQWFSYSSKAEITWSLVILSIKYLLQMEDLFSLLLWEIEEAFKQAVDKVVRQSVSLNSVDFLDFDLIFSVCMDYVGTFIEA